MTQQVLAALSNTASASLTANQPPIPHRHSNYPHGFTLIELLVVLAIAAIITSFATSSLQHLLKRSQARTTTYQLIGALSFARNAAVTKNQWITLCLSADGTNCDRHSQGELNVFIDHNRNYRIDENELLQRFQIGGERTSIQFRVSAGRDYLRYRGNGSAVEFGSILVCPKNTDPRYASLAIINFNGRPRSGRDNNKDGIMEGSNGSNISC